MSRADHFRREMQARLNRAQRRRVRIDELVSVLQSDPIAVGDDFAHLLSELKTVRHYFAAFCKEVGRPKEGILLENRWRDLALTPNELRIWDAVRLLRDTDIHYPPVNPVRKTFVLGLRTPKGTLHIAVKPFHVGSSDCGPFEIREFCRTAIELTQRFVSVFHTLL